MSVYRSAAATHVRIERRYEPDQVRQVDALLALIDRAVPAVPVVGEQDDADLEATEPADERRT